MMGRRRLQNKVINTFRIHLLTEQGHSLATLAWAIKKIYILRFFMKTTAGRLQDKVSMF